MKPQKNDLSEFVTQSDLFKEFRFLKCQPVFKTYDNCFLIRREYLKLLPAVDKFIEPPTGLYGKINSSRLTGHF